MVDNVRSIDSVHRSQPELHVSTYFAKRATKESMHTSHLRSMGSTRKAVPRPRLHRAAAPVDLSPSSLSNAAIWSRTWIGSDCVHLRIGRG